MVLAVDIDGCSPPNTRAGGQDAQDLLDCGQCVGHSRHRLCTQLLSESAPDIVLLLTQLQAMCLSQAFAHCPTFPTAATRFKILNVRMVARCGERGHVQEMDESGDQVNLQTGVPQIHCIPCWLPLGTPSDHMKLSMRRHAFRPERAARQCGQGLSTLTALFVCSTMILSV